MKKREVKEIGRGRGRSIPCTTQKRYNTRQTVSRGEFSASATSLTSDIEFSDSLQDESRLTDSNPNLALQERTSTPNSLILNRSLEMAVANAGGYNGWNENCMLISVADWYDIVDVMAAMRAMKRQNFSIVENRQQMLQILNTIQCEAPFARNVRFPEGKLYICESKGDWSRKFQQMRTSLNYKEAQRDRGDKTSGTGSSAEQNDALLAFHNSLTSITNQIGAKEFLISRADFERMFNLTWT